VEDNEVNQMVAVGLLKRRGHTVTVAGNGHEAVAIAGREPFDAILMDVQMPGMGGLEATAAIRASEERRGGHTRIIAMTAHAMTGDRERCLEAGMDDYVSKPIDAATLYTALEGPAPRRSAAGVPDGRPSQAAPVDWRELLERLGGDEEFLTRLAQLFLEDCPVRLVEIQAAVDSRDPERIRAAAHGLKGVAGNLSAAGLAAAAQVLEQIGVDARLDAAPDACQHLTAEAASVLDAFRAHQAECGREVPACAP
jgi:CheY-like chemotaxis protein